MKKYSVLLTLFLALLFSNTFYAQNEFRKWYFGNQAGLDFSSSPPIPLTNGIVNTSEGVATICDSNGNLLFYSDGTGVANSTHAAMANGLGLAGNQSSTQSVLALRKPGSQNLYYVFTVPGAGPACYSIIDMSLAAGLGSVTVKNATIHIPTTEKQVAVRHCNGIDFWIISHEFNTNTFRSYLLTNSGISSTPVISNIGEIIGGNYLSAIGALKISPDGKKLASTTFSNSTPASLGQAGFHLFDFDAATGIISNSLTLLNVNYAYGIEFSPDGTKLYGTTTPLVQNVPSVLYQWNICNSTPSSIISSQFSTTINSGAGALQWAIDGKLYIANTGSQSLSVINNPNGSGASMNLQLNSLSISPKTSGLGLPNYVNKYLRPPVPVFNHSLTCQTGSFFASPSGTFASGCNVIPFSYSGYFWDFGNPSTGTANTSTLANPTHVFSTPGTYTVKLILYSSCTNDTVYKTINVTTPSPQVNISGQNSLCKGDKRTFIASGATTYQWNGGSNSSSISISPTTSAVITVTGTSGGCSTVKSLSLTVSECLALSLNNPEIGFKFYPNPFSASITIDITNSGIIRMRSYEGILLMEKAVSAGLSCISTEKLLPGGYILEYVSENEISRVKVYKLNY